MNSKTLSKAMQFLQSGKAADALNCLKNIDENSVEMLGLKASALRQLEKYNEAKILLDKALKIEPDNPGLINNKATLMANMGDLDNAIEILKALTTQYPEYLDAKKNLQAFWKEKNKHILPSAEDRAQNLDRMINPLKSAFTQSEISRALKVREDNLAIAKKRKLNEKPKLPKADLVLVSEEWIMAAADALRDGYPETSLQLCNNAYPITHDKTAIYQIAGDAYLALNNYRCAQLCYLIAKETGKLELYQEANLITLALEMGDQQLAKNRSKFMDELPENSRLKEKVITHLNEKLEVETIVTFTKENIKRSNS